jgi:hypothetical protein
MNINQRCDIDAFLIEASPVAVMLLYLPSLKLTLSAYQAQMSCVRRHDLLCFRIFFHRGKFQQKLK